MGSPAPYSALPATYRKALKTWRPVILYFANERCPACEWAGPIFKQIAEQYRHRANIYMLITSQSPRHPLVTGTPTVLFYQNGRLVKNSRGLARRKHWRRISPGILARPRRRCCSASHDMTCHGCAAR